MHQKSLITIFLLASLTAIASQVIAIEPDEGVPVEKRIRDSLNGLKSRDFSVRLKAVAELTKIGAPAAGQISEALKRASGEERQLLERVFKAVSKDTFDSRLKALAASPQLSFAAGMPEWERFRSLFGSDKASIQYYVRLLTVEKQLFAAAAAENARQTLPALLEKRANQLKQTTVRVPLTPETFSMESYAAVLLLAGNQQTRLPRSTSTVLSAMLRVLTRPEFRELPDHERTLRLAGNYFQRGRIGVSTPLEVARTLKMPEGLTLARTVLKGRLRGRDGFHALLLIRELGNRSDVPLVESIFENRDPLFLNRDLNFASYNGDLALAVAILLRGENPADFGFPAPKSGTKFRLVTETTGFAGEQRREAAHNRYQKAFGEQ